MPCRASEEEAVAQDHMALIMAISVEGSVSAKETNPSSWASAGTRDFLI